MPDEKENFLNSIRKDNFCSKEDEPLALMIFGACKLSPRHRERVFKWAGIRSNNPKARQWWRNLVKNKVFSKGQVHGDFEGDNAGIEFALLMNVAQGFIEKSIKS